MYIGYSLNIKFTRPTLENATFACTCVCACACALTSLPLKENNRTKNFFKK